MIRDDPSVADELFRRLRAHLPERMGDLHLVGLNAHLRFYRYRPGQRFEPHMDHWYRPNERQITLHRREGRPVTRGTKYAMRSDVIYEATASASSDLR